MWDCKDKALSRTTLDPQGGETEQLSVVREKLSVLERVDLNFSFTI